MQTTEKYNWEKKVRGKKLGKKQRKKYELKVLWEGDANKQRRSPDLIFVTDINDYIRGEKSVMWRNFRFL